MPVDIATVAAIGGAVAAFLMPVYGALWRISRQIGSLDMETDSNSEEVDSIADLAESNRRRIRDIEGEIDV